MQLPRSEKQEDEDCSSVTVEVGLELVHVVLGAGTDQLQQADDEPVASSQDGRETEDPLTGPVGRELRQHEDEEARHLHAEVDGVSDGPGDFLHV